MSKKSTKFRGVRYREHESRRHAGHADRYFTIRYRTPEGQLKEEGLGWASEGWNAQRAALERAKLMEARRTGEGATTMKARREIKQQADARARQESMTFSELATGYLGWAKQNKRSWMHDEQRWRLHIQPEMGNLPVRDISAAHIESLKVRVQEKGRAAATVVQVLQLARAMLNWGIKTGMFSGGNPTTAVKFPQPNNQRLRVLTGEEVEAILNAVGQHSQTLRDICLTAAFTGLRFSEITNLEWSDLDFNRDEILVSDSKNNTSRVAIMTARLKEMLLNRRRSSTSNWVFTGKFGEKIARLSNTFFRTVDELGLNDGVSDPRKKVVFHSFRHTFCSNLGEQGENAFMLMELSGHKTFSMAKRYVKIGSDAKKAAVATMEARLDPAKVLPLAQARVKKNA